MTISTTLPPAERASLGLGFLKLTDSAPLIMAYEMGFFDQYGLDVTMHREVSWANLRDKLVAGVIDAGSLLAPLPIVTTLGLGGIREPLVTGLVLSLNGNAITISSQLAVELDLNIASVHPVVVATSLAKYIKATGRSMTFATVHTFSCHTMLLRHWLQLGGLLGRGLVRIVTVPPEQMADSLANGIVDGYCAGAPWNTVSVTRGTGVVVATGYDIWNNAPEKVLGVTETWHYSNPSTHLRLRMALMEACEWLASYENRARAAEVLSRPEYLDLPVPSLWPSLTGNYVFARGQEPAQQPHFHLFHRFQAGFPWHSDAEWMLSQVDELAPPSVARLKNSNVVSQVFRTDLYREASDQLGWACPSTDHRPFGVHDDPWEVEPGIELGADRLLKLAQG